MIQTTVSLIDVNIHQTRFQQRIFEVQTARCEFLPILSHATNESRITEQTEMESDKGRNEERNGKKVHLIMRFSLWDDRPLIPMIWNAIFLSQTAIRMP